MSSIKCTKGALYYADIKMLPVRDSSGNTGKRFSKKRRMKSNLKNTSKEMYWMFQGWKIKMCTQQVS